MKNKWFDQIRDNIWVMVMDVIVINAAYLLTFFLRYYVHSNFVPAAVPFVSQYLKFAPFYTVLCLVVFALFGLYNGMWRYARVDDMNRIIAANAVATVLLILGTTVFTGRLPFNIYAIGASFQFVFTVIIRYACRIYEMERQKLASKEVRQRKVMVVGTGVNATSMISYLEGDSLYKPVVAVGAGKNVRGLPVVEDAEEAIRAYGIDCVIVANPDYSDRKREELRRICEENKIELHDYSGFLKNQSGSLPLTELTRVISTGAKIKIGDTVYDSIEQAMGALNGRYTVVDITGKDLTIEIRESTNDMGDWARDYKRITGEDVSFF